MSLLTDFTVPCALMERKRVLNGAGADIPEIEDEDCQYRTAKLARLQRRLEGKE